MAEDKVNCGNPDATLALCPGVMCSDLLQAQGPMGQVSTETPHSYRVCLQLYHSMKTSKYPKTEKV